MRTIAASTSAIVISANRTLNVNAPATVKYCQCYDYQACETDNYEDTDAAKIIKHIKYEALRQSLEMIPEYNKAPWGLD